MTNKDRMITFTVEAPGNLWPGGELRLELRTEPVIFGYWFWPYEFLEASPCGDKTWRVVFRLPQRMWQAYLEGRLLLEGKPFVPDGSAAIPAAEIFWYYLRSPERLRIRRRRRPKASKPLFPLFESGGE